MAQGDTRIRITAQDDSAAAFRQAVSNIEAVQARASGLAAAFGAAFSVTAIVAWSKSMLDSVDALNDVADATGSTVESISALEDVALRTGTKLDTVSTALLKFNQVLNAADPDSSVAQTLKAIGLNADELRRMDPAEGLLITAKALATFADDGRKARAVQELFGKTVREVGPLLKDLADTGRLNATVTTAQAREAERFNKELSQLGKNALDAGRFVSIGLVSGLNEFIEKVKTAKREQTGLFSSLAVEAERDRQRRDAMFTGSFGFPVGNAGRGVVNPDFVRPSLPDVGGKKEKPEKVPREAPGIRQADSELLRYFENLQRAIAAEQDLTEVQKAQRLILATPATGFSEELRSAVLSAARLKDQLKAAAAEQEELNRLAAELDAGLRAGEQEAQGRLKSLLDATPSAELQKTREDLILLTREFEAGRISEERYLEAVSQRAGITGASLERVKTLSEEMTLTFSSAIENLVVEGGRAGDVFKALEKDILRIVTQQYVTKPLIDGIGKFIGGGEGLGSLATKVIGGLFGARAMGGPVQAGGTYLVGERGPELFKAPVSGSIVPTSQLAGSLGSRTVNITINPPPGMNRQSSSQLAADVARQLRQAERYNG